MVATNYDCHDREFVAGIRSSHSGASAHTYIRMYTFTDIGTLNILCGSYRELVLCVNTSLGRLQYTCGHENYEEKPFNILRFYISDLKTH